MDVLLRLERRKENGDGAVTGRWGLIGRRTKQRRRFGASRWRAWPPHRLVVAPTDRAGRWRVFFF